MSIVYNRLPSATATRVVVIHPGARHEPLAATLGTVDLDDEPDFEAISYAWGPPGELESIILDEYDVQIRGNLHV